MQAGRRAPSSLLLRPASRTCRVASCGIVVVVRHACARAEGRGVIVDATTVEVYLPGGAKQTLKAKHILVAVGGAAAKIPIEGAVRTFIHAYGLCTSAVRMCRSPFVSELLPSDALMEDGATQTRASAQRMPGLYICCTCCHVAGTAPPPTHTHTPHPTHTVTISPLLQHVLPPLLRVRACLCAPAARFASAASASGARHHL